jgi:alkaline phosphatase
MVAVAASAVGLALVAPAAVPAGAVPPDPPKNIIVFIGDGMGPEQVEIGGRVKGSPLFVQNQANWDAIARLNTDSLDGVTDSAAGATALATGFETHNGWLSMIPPVNDPQEVRTVLENAEARGMATGLFSTGDLPDATPGAFAAHVTDRGEDEEVARQMHLHEPEFLLGGRGGGAVEPLEGQSGVFYAKNLRQLQGYADGASNDGPVYGLMGAQTLAYAIDREEEGAVGKHPTIAQGTKAALDVLSRDPDGFFLMVEAGQIDWAGHSRDGGWTAAEMLAFDKAIKAAFDWVGNSDDTLIVVTADHETGGLEVDGSLDVVGMRQQTASTEFIWGAIRKNNVESNIRSKMATYTGITDLSEDEVDLIHDNKEMGIADVLAERWNVGWELSGTDEGDHTGAPVPIYAAGPRATDFAYVSGTTPYANERVGQLLLSYLPVP